MFHKNIVYCIMLFFTPCSFTFDYNQGNVLLQQARDYRLLRIRNQRFLMILALGFTYVSLLACDVYLVGTVRPKTLWTASMVMFVLGFVTAEYLRFD